RRDDDLRPARQIQRFDDVVEGHPAVRRADGMRGRQARAPREFGLEPREMRTLAEFAASLAVRDDLFSIGQDSRAVARAGREHGKLGNLILELKNLKLKTKLETRPDVSFLSFQF